MLSLADAQHQLLLSVASTNKTQQVAISDAMGMVLAHDIAATIDVPLNDNSAMDGYAIIHKEVQQGQPIRVSQRITAGDQAEKLFAGSAAQIFTGGMIPAGADTVVIQENCQFDKAKQQLIIDKLPERGANIRRQGQDISAGISLLQAGKKLNAVDIGLIASIGQTHCTVYQPLRVAILATGDELIEPGKPLKPGQIYNSNRYMLAAICQQLGYQSVILDTLADNADATKTALLEATEQADIIISSGGVSVGEEDYIKQAISESGSLDLWKVQIKPGKPVAFGQINNTPIMGLPGNPVSSFMVFQLLAKPVLQKRQGQQVENSRSYLVKAGFEKTACTREEYLRVKLIQNQQTQNWQAVLFNNQSSGVLSSLSWADGLVRQKVAQSIKEGDMVEFLPFFNGII